MLEFDVIIIGGGPGGNACALDCARRGFKTALVEKNFPGGDAINDGYFPLKVLLSNKEREEVLNDRVKKASLAWQDRLNKTGVTLIEGNALIEDFCTLSVKKENNAPKKLTAEKLVLATGSQPVSPVEGVKVDGQGFITYQHAVKASGWENNNIAILGADVEGCEFATFLNNLGMEVTLFETEDNIMPLCDKDTADYLKKSFVEQGINVKTNTRVVNCTYSDDNKVKLIFENKDPEIFEKVLLTGKNIPCLPEGFKNIGLSFKEDGFIQVNSNMETSKQNIFALGDVIGGVTSANAAIMEGKTVASNIAGEKAEANYFTMPYVFFTSPQITAVGLREMDVKNQEIPYKVAKIDLGYNLRALSIGCEGGFCKVLLSQKEDHLLGVHLIGENISELIHLPALAYKNKIPGKDITSLPLPHPTMAEIIQQAIEAAN